MIRTDTRLDGMRDAAVQAQGARDQVGRGSITRSRIV